MKFFKVDKARDRVAADTEFYRCDLSPVVDYVRKNGIQNPFDADELPSWSKVAADPIKADGFLTTMMQAMFYGKHNLKTVSTSRAFRPDPKAMRVCMMFAPANIKRDNLQAWDVIAENALPGWSVIALHSETESATGKKGMTNATSEYMALEHIQDAKNRGVKSVLFIASQMSQRSFSVGAITELYLAYDNGDSGATIQKMSRALTPNGTENKLARIVSLSFDPNRDEKFDPWIVTTALNLVKRTGIPIKQAFREVLDTLDIFSMTGERIKMGADTYHAEMLSRNGFAKIMGATSDLSQATLADVKLLASLGLNGKGKGRQSTTAKGKTRAALGGKKGGKKMSDKNMEKKAKESIKFIVEYLDTFMWGTNSTTVSGMVEVLKTDPYYRAEFENFFKVTPDLVCRLFERGVLNSDLLELRTNS